MISVAMATYNGEKYIYKQLKSIFEQTKMPDEVIISDDGSSDNTVSIINSFIEEKKLFGKWKVTVNSHNLGYTKNFFSCINKCKGDIIFLSDQDDIWDINKIQILSHVLEKNEKIKVIWSEIDYIDQYDRKIKYKHDHGFSLLKRNLAKFQKYYRVGFSEFCMTGGYQGFGMAFRKKYVEDIISYLDTEKLFCHDVTIAFCGAVNSGFYIYNKTLNHYRLHDDNAIGSPSIRDRVKRNRIEVLNESKFICEGFTYILGILYSKKIVTKHKYEHCNNFLKKLINTYQSRIININNKNIKRLLLNIVRVKYYPNIKTFMGDLFYSFNGFKSNLFKKRNN